jgi:glutamate dehydrogenase (NADP+)
MSQNSQRMSWTFEEVDGKLKEIMINIFHSMYDAAEQYGVKGNLVAGANIAGFIKVATSMLWQGISY